ncbi:MAG: hypothetical protein H6621_12550 [Halobacteriovoraceae bacterium]|nr:hypothetical protein [Halobacteriovoraceae bacterium]
MNKFLLSNFLILFLFFSCGKNGEPPVEKKTEPSVDKPKAHFNRITDLKSLFDPVKRADCLSNKGKENHLTDHLAMQDANGDYLLYTDKQIQSLSEDPNAFHYHFRLMADIDLSSLKSTSIGSNRDPFQGTFDGNFCELSNFQLSEARNTSSHANVALFPYAKNAEFKNLILNHFKISGHAAGSLVAFAVDSQFENILVSHSEVEADKPVGGVIAAGSDVTLKNIGVESTRVQGNEFVGGVAGKITAFNLESRLLNFYSYNVSVQGLDVMGGVVGSLSYSRVDQGIAFSTLTGRDYLGGFSGKIAYSAINNLINLNVIKGNKELGVLTSSLNTTSVKQSFYFAPYACSLCKIENVQAFQDENDLFNDSSILYGDWDFQKNSWTMNKNHGPQLF